MKGKVWIGLAVAAAAIAGASAFVPGIVGWFGPAPLPVVEVKREAFRRKVLAEGNLKAVRATPLTAPMEAQGPLKIAWMLPDGAEVTKGQVVVRFDATDKTREVADGKADRDTADHRITRRKAEDAAALKNLDRDAGQATLELESAKTFQSRDPEIFSRVEIIESDIDQGLAGKRAEHAGASRKTKESLAKADLDLLEIERRKADIRVRQGESGLKALEMTAPHDGILSYRRDWRGNAPRVGETVWSGEPIAEIPDLSEMEAEVYVLEADAGGLATGLPATVALESRPLERYRSTVLRVDNLARARFRGTPVQYFSLVLSLEHTDPTHMKPGQRVGVDLVMDERLEALVVPRDAVFEKDGKKVVYKRAGGEFRMTEVQLGPLALGKVVIESGVAEGDVVALRDPTRPEDEPSTAPSEGAAPASPMPSRGDT